MVIVDSLDEKLLSIHTVVGDAMVGGLLQMAIMNQYVTRGQVHSFLLAVGVITLLMLLVFGSVRLGLIAMVPNLSPAIVAGGFMGYLGVPLEFVTMTIALAQTTLVLCVTFFAFTLARVNNMANMGLYSIAAILATGFRSWVAIGHGKQSLWYREVYRNSDVLIIHNCLTTGNPSAVNKRDAHDVNPCAP